MLATVAIGYVPPLQPDGAVSDRPPEKMHFMSFKNSYAAAVAAAVAAVVFSAAFQPAEASIITIDTFTEAQVTTASGTESSIGGNSVLEGSFGGFTTREAGAGYEQADTTGFNTILASSNGSGLGTLQLTSNGAGSGSTNFASGGFYYNTNSSEVSVDLTGQQYPGFWIETGATSATPANTAIGFIRVITTAGAGDFQYELPGMWASNTGTGILFSDIVAAAFNFGIDLDFTQVNTLLFGISIPQGAAGSTEYNATANFTAISVPEPTHMVFVAGIGAAVGAWRLRKLRRSRTAAGAAIAG